MSRSTKRPYLHCVGFKHKYQRVFRDLSRRLIRRKGKSALKDCMSEHDFLLTGIKNMSKVTRS